MSDVPLEIFREILVCLPAIFREILVRLPAESLVRFRSVCKSWQSMIDEPSFVRSHTTNNHLTSPRLLIGTWTGAFYSFPLESLNYVNGEQTIHATHHAQKLNDDMGEAMSVFECSMALCNSLILFHHHPGKNWVIWNPLTGDFHELPMPDFIDGPTFPMGVGFGYDSRSDDYKVVWIGRFNEKDGAPQTLIYSLKSKSWRFITNCPFFLGFMNWGVYLNGAVHWISSRETIVALDLATEEYRELQAAPPPPLPPPPPMESPQLVRNLYASDGYLVLSDAGDEGIGRAWVMRGYGTDKPVWVELCSADQRIVFGGVKGHLRPSLLAYLNSERRLIMHHANRIIWWDIENCCVKKVTIDGLLNSITFLQVVPGSLFRFNGGGSTRVKRSEEASSNRLELSATTIDCGCSSGGVMSRSGREILGTVFLIED